MPQISSTKAKHCLGLFHQEDGLGELNLGQQDKKTTNFSEL